MTWNPDEVARRLEPILWALGASNSPCVYQSQADAPTPCQHCAGKEWLRDHYEESLDGLCADLAAALVEIARLTQEVEQLKEELEHMHYNPGHGGT